MASLLSQVRISWVYHNIPPEDDPFRRIPVNIYRPLDLAKSTCAIAKTTRIDSFVRFPSWATGHGPHPWRVLFINFLRFINKKKEEDSSLKKIFLFSLPANNHRFFLFNREHLFTTTPHKLSSQVNQLFFRNELKLWGVGAVAARIFSIDEVRISIILSSNQQSLVRTPMGALPIYLGDWCSGSTHL